MLAAGLSSLVAFDLILVGRAREHLACFVVTLREVDRIGRGRRRVALRQIDAVHLLTATNEVVYRAGENLVRPRDARLTLADCEAVRCPGAVARQPDFQLLFRRLLGRLSSLARFHGPGPLPVDSRGLIGAAESVRLVRNDTRWTRWSRYSRRQDRRMEWEGLVGSVLYEGDLAPFWPYLVFGPWTHVGSATTFGLGGYRVDAMDRAVEPSAP